MAVKEKKEKNPNKNPVQDKLAKLEADVEHWKNEYYRAYADMQNLRKAIEKDHHEAIRYRAEGFVADLLPILDGFHMALQNEAKSEEMKNFLIGFEYIYRNMVSVLENEGVKEFAPKIDDEFDPNVMQALETKLDDGKPNRVLQVMAKGYKLHDHLIRPAVVIVSTNKKDEPNEEKDNNVELDA